MPKQNFRSPLLVSQWLILLVVLFLGLFFRFNHLEGRVFWVDEVATAIRVSGQTIPSVTQDLIEQPEAQAQDLLDYQFASSNLQTTWQALTSSPEHAPLFFLLTRLWANWHGSSLITMRALAAVISLLVLPAFYWLLQELFASSLISTLGVMLMSGSPFFVAYAQEARPYSLWTVSVLLMSASYLRAVSKNRISSWVVYTFALALAFYTSLLSFLVAIGQGLALFLAKYRSSKHQQIIIQKYLISNLIALALFTPWIQVIWTGISDLETNTAWMRTNLDFLALVATWIGTILLIFGDLPLSPDVNAVQMAIAVLATVGCLGIGFILRKWWAVCNSRQQNLVRWLMIAAGSGIAISLFAIKDSFEIDFVTLIGAIVAILILALAGYSLYYLTQTAQPKQGLFVWCLLLAVPLPLLVSDLLFQGQSSGAPRYFIPTQLGIQIAVAYTLGHQLAHNSQLKNQQQIWLRLLIVAFISLGIFSCVRTRNISPIYVKSRNVYNPEIAKIINQQPQSLILLEPPLVGDVLSLAHDLHPDTRIQVFSGRFDPQECTVDSELKSTCYLLKPSTQLQAKLASNPSYQLQLVYQPQRFTSEQIALDLWQIKISD